MSKLWQKSTTDTESETAKKVEAFTVGNDYTLDQQLVPYDLKGSRVHAKALQDAGVVSQTEYKRLASALEEIHEAWKKGEFTISVEDEDMHTAIENDLVQKLGDLGKKIHTARSRNDQVLTALRLYEKEALSSILAKSKGCAKLLLEFADRYEAVPMPGFTHTRKAMMSSVALWSGGFAELLILQLMSSNGVWSLINRSPLGSAAGFGTSFNIDRDAESEALGFEAPLVCSTTAQLSRGFTELQLVQFLSSLTSVANRFASDLIQFSSESTPYFTLHPVVCTGSSIMPQKKNPDVAELVRAHHAVVTGHASTLQMLGTNLTSGYHRDLQLSKEPVMDAVQKTGDALEAMALLVSHLQPNRQVLADACSGDIFAAEAAYEIVKRENLSFREAYKKLAQNPKLTKGLTTEKVMENCSHLGSAGTPGIGRLRTMLNSIELP
ncbi:MAG: argininosuccinate lyase [Bacteroidetes bacterium]|jgi:argininosuccinate lyase|nr:argininosuccinate lyase [Bacteroidota bacterium]